MAKAVESFDKVLQECPNAPEVRLIRMSAARDLARYRGDLRSLPSAIEDIKALVAEFPAYLDAKHELAKTYYILGRPNDAIPLLTEILKTEPGFSTAHQTLGIFWNSLQSKRIRQISLPLKLETPLNS